jgi:aspartyl-tRNA(Asn)/glutamyl-tRNA(Gln) amidotransferase subunit B
VLSLAKAGTISGKQAKELYAKLKGTTRDPKDLVKELGMSQLTDTKTLEVECKAVLDANEKQVAQYRSGKTALFGFFVGEVMKRTKGRANPGVVNETLKRLLEARASGATEGS